MPNTDIVANYFRLIGFLLVICGVAAPSIWSSFLQDARLLWRRRDRQGALWQGWKAFVTVIVAACALAAGFVLLAR